MPSQALSKTSQVLCFFAQQYGAQGIPRKRLVKLAYMADVISRECLGRPITELQYIKDHFGPNARELEDFTAELQAQSAADEWTERDAGTRWIRLRASASIPPFEFSLGELEVLGYVAANYLKMPVEEFIESVVKQTDPFLQVNRIGDLLPMSLVDGTVRDSLGFNLETVAHTAHEIERGNYVTLTQIADELRRSSSAPSPMLPPNSLRVILRGETEAVNRPPPLAERVPLVGA